MPPRILIVDDSSLMRNKLRVCFESEPGWEVCGEAANGQDAIERAHELRPNFILLDLSMPVMNGLDAAKVLNKLMPSVPLLMYTSFSTGHLEQEALKVGIRRVIIKSEPLADLVAAVGSLLSKEAAGR